MADETDPKIETATSSKDQKAAQKEVDEANRAANTRVQHRTVDESTETALTVEEGTEKGYLGRKVDPEPNHAYTQPGHTG